MKPDYAKATTELLDKLRRKASTVPVHEPPAQPQPGTITGWTIINAPKDCTIYITPQPPAPPEQG